MKKGLMALAAAGAVAVVTLVQPTQASAQEGATVAREFGCNIQASDWSGDVPLFTDETTHFTESAGGKAIFQCHFDIPEGLEPDRAVRMTDFECSTQAGTTNYSESISTPGGKVQLRCVVH